ncbi:MAG: hypothetical protein ACRECT_07890 [Thermoplasmata archaeon]
MYVNPTEYLSPIIAILIGVIPVLYFRWKGALFGIAAAAYFLAIGSKGVVEVLFAPFFQLDTLPVYLAYGLLTFVFEVGLAYLFLRPVWKGERPPDLHAGWAYGSYLAFYENAVLLGLLPLLGLLALSSSSVTVSSSDPYAASFLPSALRRVSHILSLS